MYALVSGLRAVGDPGVRVYVYATAAGHSYWSRRVRALADAFVDVEGLDGRALAQRLQEDDVHVAVDMHGLTRGGHQSALAWQAAPVQASFMGQVGTSGLQYVDFVLADAETAAATAAHGPGVAFSERLLLLPRPALVPPHSELHAHVPRFLSPGRPPPAVHPRPHSAALAYQGPLHKLGPTTWALWTNVRSWPLSTPAPPLSLTPACRSCCAATRAQFCGCRHGRCADRASSGVVPASPHPFPSPALRLQGTSEALARLRREAVARGVAPQRVVATPRLPWLEHVRAKGAAHIALDPPRVNGHMTSVDALWAGLPLVTARSLNADGRLAAALARTHGCAVTVTSSLREYETVAGDLAARPRAYRAARACSEDARKGSPLFDATGHARDFLRAVRAAVEGKCASRRRVAAAPQGARPAGTPERHAIQARHHVITAGASGALARAAYRVPSSPRALARNVSAAEAARRAQWQRPLRLHIGAELSHPAYMTWNAPSTAQAPHVHFTGPLHRLAPFANGSLAEIYASHVLEHIPFRCAAPLPGRSIAVPDTPRAWPLAQRCDADAARVGARAGARPRPAPPRGARRPGPRPHPGPG